MFFKSKKIEPKKEDNTLNQDLAIITQMNQEFATSLDLNETMQTALEVIIKRLNAQAAKIYEKVKKKEKLSKDTKTLNLIKDIGQKMEDSITEYFYQSKLDDPTKYFDWEYILIENKKVRNAWCMPRMPNVHCNFKKRN